MSAKLHIARATLIVLLSAGAICAQERDPGQSSPREAVTAVELDAMDRLVDARDRESLYPRLARGPLEIVGTSQEDNDLRAGVPALKNSDLVVAMVDTQEVRERLLAIYSGQEVQPKPHRLALPEGAAAPSGGAEVSTEMESLDATRAEAENSDSGGDGPDRKLVFLSLLTVGGASWIVLRLRR